MNRIDRLMGLLTMLQSRNYVTLETISAKFGISERTVYRDLKALDEIGIPIYFEPELGYTIQKGFFLPPIMLTLEEANALILTSTLSERYSDQATHSRVETAIEKIRAVLRSSDKEKANHLQSQIRIYTGDNASGENNFLQPIQEAIISRHQLQIDYQNNNNQWSKRKLEPIGLTFYSNQWHMIAWCWLRNAYRDFKIASIIKLERLNEPFKKTDHLDINEYIQSLSK